MKSKKLSFIKKNPKEVLSEVKNGVFNFQNLYSVYLFNKEPIFKKEINSPNNFIFPDGKILSLFLRIPQVRGPSFTKNFLEEKLEEKQKHFFIGPSKEDLKVLQKKFPKLTSASSYDPPFIKNIIFPEKEIKKIVNEIKKNKPDYVWVCIGNPKQEVLANQLYRRYPAFYFSIGAAMDFLLGKKKEAPKIFRKLGLEWFYRLITDFKYSKKKVWRSLQSLRFLSSVKTN